MKTYSDKYSAQEISPSKEPFFVFDMDDVFFTSREHVVCYAPDGADKIADVLLGVSGQTQKINPDQAVSSIGTMTVRIADPLVRLENLFGYSEQLHLATGYQVTKTANDRIAPDGTGTMTKIVPTVINDAHDIEKFVTIPIGEKIVESIWAVADGYDFLEISLWNSSDGYVEETVFDVLNGSVVSGNGIVESTDAGIFKCTFAATGIHTVTSNTVVLGVRETAGARSFAGNGTDGVHMWGASVTRGSVIRKYTPTPTGPGYPIPVFSRPVSEKINEKLLVDGRGMRGKIGRVYVGYRGLTFDQYDLRLTYVIDSLSFKDGVYTVRLSDLQRQQRKRIFSPDETTLISTITIDDTIIPVSTAIATEFQAVAHGGEWTSWPNKSVAYVKIEKEVVVHSGLTFDSVNGWHLPVLERGALGTVAKEHTVDSGKAVSKRRKVIEHIFIEGAAPKIAYALLTGILLNGSSPEDSFPDHWALGISPDFVRLSDFQNLGDDYWNTADDSGKFVRIENPGGIDGKQFIEKELMLWMGSYMPIYSTGEIGVKRLSKVLSNSGYQAVFDQQKIVGYSELRHDMRSVINQISVLWNWVDSRDTFTKESLLIDAESISIHGRADEKVFKFKAVHTGLHTDEDILKHFDTIRDRFSGPPLLLSLTLAPSQSAVEVGDTVRVMHPNIRDFNVADGVLDRTFEVQQVTTNWQTGQLRVSLFGSSQAAGTLAPTTLTPVMQDAWYVMNGIELSTVLTIVAGAVTVNGTLTGHATDVDNAVYYYDGDLTIGAGVTVTITQNVQLRIKGMLTINGDIDGTGNGAAGGAGTSQYTDATTTDSYSIYSTLPQDQKKELDFHGPVAAGKGGFGMTSPAGVFELQGGAVNGLPVSGWLQSFAMYSIPFYDLKNVDGLSLSGYPKILHGIGGGGGMPLVQRTGMDVGLAYIRASGGTGGTGGAGLMIISRGLSFGVAGGITLDGDSGALGNHYDATRFPEPGTARFHAGAGGAGSTGGLLVMLDGAVTSPDLSASTVSLNYGDQAVPIGATVVDGARLTELRFSTGVGSGVGYWIRYWPYAESVLAGQPFKGFDDVDAIDSAQRVQYIPIASAPVQDESNFPELVSGKYKDLLFFQSADTPVANTGYGADLDTVSDGSRFVVGSNGTSGVPDAVQICRSISNPSREQTITDTGSSLGFTIGGSFRTVYMSEDGNRVAVGAWVYTGTNSAQGAVYIYSRNGVTWSLEQRIIASTPKNNGHFGKIFTVDRAFENIVIFHNNGANYELQYWTRTGTAWSYQNDLPDPSSVSSSYATDTSFHLSGDGNYFVLGDQFVSGAGGLVGAFSVWSRTGTTWSILFDAIQPDESLAYTWGHTTNINHDGTVLIVVGGAVQSGVQGVLVYQRQGDVLNLIQRFSVESSNQLGVQVKDLSASGLAMVLNDYNAGKAYIYKRSSVEQAFVLTQTIVNQDAGAWSVNERYALSDDSQWFISGNYSTDVGAANSGSIHAHQFVIDSEK